MKIESYHKFIQSNPLLCEKRKYTLSWAKYCFFQAFKAVRLLYVCCVHMIKLVILL